MFTVIYQNAVSASIPLNSLTPLDFRWGGAVIQISGSALTFAVGFEGRMKDFSSSYVPVAGYLMTGSVANPSATTATGSTYGLYRFDAPNIEIRPRILTITGGDLTVVGSYSV